MSGVQGAFYGSSLPAAQIEALIAAHIPRTHISEIADVYGSKWWDYRRLAPGHSFYLFAHHYYKESRAAARKFVSERPNTWKRGAERSRTYQFVGPALVQMEVKDVWGRDQAHITGLWKAMLVADALGIPYPEFVRLACRIAIDNLWKRIPRPSQLYSEKLGAMILDEWETLREERLLTATHPLYLTENYAGLQVQDDYRSWLIEHLKDLKSNIVPALMTAVYTRPQLPEGLAEQHFPANALKRARLLAA